MKAHAPAIVRLALQRHPIYRIRGDGAKASLARLALRDVKVIDGRQRVTFLKAG